MHAVRCRTMDNIDRIMKEADRLGFGVSYGKYYAACHAGHVDALPSPPKPQVPEKPSRSCRHCGKLFICSRGNQIYCSPECKYSAQLARQTSFYKEKGRRKKKQLTLVCAECGADFKALRSSQKYCCKECAKDGQRKAQARWWAAHKKGASDGVCL